mgnify:CR=1 FL=1
MDVYIVDEFSRDDANVEFNSRVIGAYTSEEEAIKCAKCIEDKCISHYGYRIEHEPGDSIVYSATLDTDPENEAEYADFIVLTVIKHKLDSKYKEE